MRLYLRRLTARPKHSAHSCEPGCRPSNPIFDFVNIRKRPVIILNHLPLEGNTWFAKTCPEVALASRASVLECGSSCAAWVLFLHSLIPSIKRPTLNFQPATGNRLLTTNYTLTPKGRGSPA